MKAPARWQGQSLALITKLQQSRYLKFAMVGASGTVVNLLVLRLGHEYLFHAIEATSGKPYASLALAIAVSTLNNFTWNRVWTWADRIRAHQAQTHQNPSTLSKTTHLVSQFGKYALASWFGIAVQYGLTLWLSHWLHYMVANLVAIVVASVSNFLANDRWTFHRKR